MIIILSELFSCCNSLIEELGLRSVRYTSSADLLGITRGFLRIGAAITAAAGRTTSSAAC